MLISILCIGCIDNNQKVSISNSENIESNKENYICIEYENNSSWNVYGNGCFELQILTYKDSKFNNLLSKEYDLSENEIKLSFSVDENLNVSYSDNISKETKVIRPETELLKVDMDTSYTQTEKYKLSINEEVPLLLFCKNMTSIQSEFLKDYTSLTADFAIVIVLKKVT